MTTFSAAAVLLAAAVYLLAFYGVAWLTDKGRVPVKLINHPALYVLSLGVIVSSWSFYTALISASNRGYGYNAYYIGYAAAFLFAPILLQPVLQITRTYQLGSLADLFAFRFRSPWAGTLTSIILLLCIFPLLAVQIFAVASTTEFLAPTLDARLVALLYCLALLGFTLRFGTRDVTGRERNDSIVVSLAFESVFKLLVLSGAGLFAVYGVFGGFGELNAWLREQPPQVTRLDIYFLQNTTNLLILLFFTAAIAMPHMFHMIFHENRNPQHLGTASWGVPLYLLTASLPTLPILWSYDALNADTLVRFAGLAMGLLSDSPAITLLFYVGGVAAACGMIIVLTMSVSSICLNHLLLRVRKPPTGSGLYRWLLLLRRLFIVGIFAGGYFAYLWITDGRRLLDAGYFAFIASVQFLPGILTLLYWPAANSKGFITGLLAGLVVWTVLGFVPYFAGVSLLDLTYSAPGIINWDLVASASLLANMCSLIVVSLLTNTSREERRAAVLCSMDTIRQPLKYGLLARTTPDFVKGLTLPLGEVTARQEVARALADLGLMENETRPYQLLQLRAQIEANLSALLGPTISHQIIERNLPFAPGQIDATNKGINFIETQLETYSQNLSGIALDLDTLRRHHRQVLQNLPLGVCAIDGQGLISIWNSAMSNLTRLSGDNLTGLPMTALPPPWKDLLIGFMSDRNTTHIPRQVLLLDGKQRWFSLHKASLEYPLAAVSGITSAGGPQGSGQVILVEDQTETAMLEAELTHAERLSSVGRLAAGVAHEIGNPVTGIACLAQNLRDETADREQRSMAEQIILQTRRISGIVQTLVRFSHSGMDADLPRRQEQVCLFEATAEAIQLLSLQQDGRKIRLQNGCQPALCIRADRQRIQQILLNLLTNARDASPDGSTVDVTNGSNGAVVTLIVSDTGSGIPEAIQGRVFEPFFTTKDPGKGTGLGLALVYSIVNDLGGSVTINSPVDTVGRKGTKVIVTFPCYDRAPELAA
jgi:signal transduction histidine kinase/Na+/proline symporter